MPFRHGLTNPLSGCPPYKTSLHALRRKKQGCDDESRRGRVFAEEEKIPLIEFGILLIWKQARAEPGP